MSCETTCVKCYQDWISCGPYNSIITVNTGLDAGNYTAILTDKFDHKYQLPVTVNASGQFEINFADVPEGLFNEFGGAILLEMSQNGCDKITIPILDGYDYIDTECIEITVKGGQMDKMDIGCPLTYTLGPENITNGTFTGNANQWTLGTGWAYNVNNVVKTGSVISALEQVGGLTNGSRYRVSLDIGGSLGFVTVSLGPTTHYSFNAGAGGVTFDGYWIDSNPFGVRISVIASATFNGTIDNVSVKELL